MRTTMIGISSFAPCIQKVNLGTTLLKSLSENSLWEGGRLLPPRDARARIPPFSCFKTGSKKLQIIEKRVGIK